jgi:hypothetical protein
VAAEVVHRGAYVVDVERQVVTPRLVVAGVAAGVGRAVLEDLEVEADAQAVKR